MFDEMGANLHRQPSCDGQKFFPFDPRDSECVGEVDQVDILLFFPKVSFFVEFLEVISGIESSAYAKDG
jgi:hypothetical protein